MTTITREYLLEQIAALQGQLKDTTATINGAIQGFQITLNKLNEVPVSAEVSSGLGEDVAKETTTSEANDNACCGAPTDGCDQPCAAEPSRVE